MAALSVARHLNFELFQRAEPGASVRVAGRLAGASEGRSLLTTDGGSLSVMAGPELELEKTVDGAFLEVVGTKAADSQLQAVGVVMLPKGEVDAELWNEAVKLMHAPQLQDIFAPRPQSTALEA